MSPRRAAALRSQDAAPNLTLREHLVAATDQLLDRQSAGDVTTRVIAHHAHVSDGVLYNHFADKHELLMVAMLRRYERLLARLEAAGPTAGEGTVVGNVQAFARALVEVESDALRHGAGLLAHPPLLHRFWAEIHHAPFGIDRLRRPLSGYLASERDLGRVAATLDIQAATTVVFGVCAMAALARNLNPGADRATLDADLDATLSTAVRGFGVNPPP